MSVTFRTCFSLSLLCSRSPPFFFLMNRRPPRSTPFPYPTLFRSRPSMTPSQSLSLPSQSSVVGAVPPTQDGRPAAQARTPGLHVPTVEPHGGGHQHDGRSADGGEDRKSTRLNSSHTVISYAGFCL